jgi:c-di-GMP-binding flagellar brake protein YcgR
MFQDTRPAELGPNGSSDAWANFQVTDSAELLRLLKLLRDGSVPVTLSAPEGLTASTQLWSLDAEQRLISFSADADSVHMQRLAQSDEAVAVAYLDSVKLQFELSELLLVHGSQGCALRARLPAVLYRFQRRASFRVRTFDRRTPQAQLRHPSMPDMRLALRIVDISVGGCAMVLPNDVPALQPGSRLARVRIQLDGDTSFDTTLLLQHVSAMHDVGRGVRLGCAFTELEGQTQRTLQRYIDQTQQRRRLLSLR